MHGLASSAIVLLLWLVGAEPLYLPSAAPVQLGSFEVRSDVDRMTPPGTAIYDTRAYRYHRSSTSAGANLERDVAGYRNVLGFRRNWAGGVMDDAPTGISLQIRDGTDGRQDILLSDGDSLRDRDHPPSSGRDAKSHLNSLDADGVPK